LISSSAVQQWRRERDGPQSPTRTEIPSDCDHGTLVQRRFGRNRTLENPRAEARGGRGRLAADRGIYPASGEMTLRTDVGSMPQISDKSFI
jgi:hypothetical protein